MAWNTTKQTGDTLTADEYNSMVQDQVSRVLESEKGEAGGVATLDDDGQVPANQLGNSPGGSGEVDLTTLREKLAPENTDKVLVWDSRTGTYAWSMLGNLRR